VGFPHLSKAIPNVAMYLADAPAEVLAIFKEVRRPLPVFFLFTTTRTTAHRTRY
jgi:hypothetical protein